MIPRYVKVALGVLVAAVLVMGFYANRLMHQAQVPVKASTDFRPITPPVAGPTAEVRLMVASDADGLLRPKQVALALPSDPGLRAREILRALLGVYLDKSSPHPLGAGADVEDVFLVDNNTAIIDVNAAFAEGHPSGVLVEGLTLASVAQTLAANFPGVTRMKILVDGKERDTLAGHADLTGFYHISAGNWPVGQ